MWFTRTIVLAAVVVLALMAVPDVGAGGSHHWTLGFRQPHHQLMSTTVIREPSRLLRKVVEKYRLPFHGRYGLPIRFISCLDQYQNGEGGYVTLNKGGLGLHSVSLRLKSQRGHGYHFICEIYGA